MFYFERSKDFEKSEFKRSRVLLGYIEKKNMDSGFTSIDPEPREGEVLAIECHLYISEKYN